MLASLDYFSLFVKARKEKNNNSKPKKEKSSITDPKEKSKKVLEKPEKKSRQLKSTTKNNNKKDDSWLPPEQAKKLKTKMELIYVEGREYRNHIH